MGLENLFLGFQVAVTPYNLFIAVVGILLGTIIGVLPGLGGANGVAILLPLTFTMPPTSAIILLTCLYWGALFGGAITSVLFNIPGEPWSVATTFDGYPLAKDGQSGQALTAAFSSSFVGALFSIVLITFFAPLLAEVALKFGPPEFFAIQLLTFSSFVGLGGGNPLKSLATILIGFILSTVGLDIVTGQLRLTYGFTDLMKGFDFIIAVIGLFGIGEILLSVEEGLRFQGAKTDMNMRVVLDTWKTLPRYFRTFVRSSIIGFWMGFKPGGATPASFMSYAFAKRFSKNPERFGKGEIEGIVAPETAAHAAGVAAMLPMITLGIPGSPTAAVMLGGLIIWGLQPGPMLFVDNLVHADLRRDRLCLQEARLPLGAAGTGPRPGRHGGKCPAAESDYVPRIVSDLLHTTDLGRHYGSGDLFLRIARVDPLAAQAARAPDSISCPNSRVSKARSRLLDNG
jgi:putative tricarboxylic transport membrane protein